MKKLRKDAYTYEELSNAAREVAFAESGAATLFSGFEAELNKLMLELELEKRGYYTSDKEFTMGRIYGTISAHDISSIIDLIDVDINAFIEPVRDRRFYDGLMLDELKAIAEVGLLEMNINTYIYDVDVKNWFQTAICCEAVHGIPFERAEKAIQQLRAIIRHDLIDMNRYMAQMIKSNAETYSSMNFRIQFMLDSGIYFNVDGTVCK